jgi:hypothetical protein
MRLSADRHNRDRMGVETALRLIRHQARTSLIKLWTGLSPNRIRNLVRACREHPPRHRGHPPRNLNHFTHTQRAIEETTILAGRLSILGVVPLAPEPLQLPDWERAQLICDAYEVYEVLVPGPRLITFEHALLLSAALIDTRQLVLDNCVICRGLVISEPFTRGMKRCQRCASVPS